MINRTFVSVEPETSELSSDHSPAKTYTSLQTSSSKTATTDAQGSPGTPALQIDESVTTDACTVTLHSSVAERVNSQSFGSGKELEASKFNPEPNTTPLRTMEETSAGINQEMHEGYVVPGTIQSISSRYSQIIYQSFHDGLDQFNAETTGQDLLRESANMEIQPNDQARTENLGIPSIAPGSVNITRIELLILNDFLGRIPPEFVVNDEIEADQPFTLMVVDESEPPTMLLTSSQEEVGVPTSSNTASQAPPDRRPVGKRRRPKYSLTTAMLKKHPIKKFSATGPIDRNKNPHKWWCRV